MDSVDMLALAKILTALVAVEAMRGANEAAAQRNKPPYEPELFDSCEDDASRALYDLEKRYDRD